MLVYHSKRLNGIGKAPILPIRIRFGVLLKPVTFFVWQGVLGCRDSIKIDFKFPVKMPRNVFAMTKF